MPARYVLYGPIVTDTWTPDAPFGIQLEGLGPHPEASEIGPRLATPLVSTKYAVAVGVTPNELARRYVQIASPTLPVDCSEACWSARVAARAAASAAFCAVRRWR